jgi:hypothetical protein
MQTTYNQIKTKVTELSGKIKSYPYEERYTQLVKDMSSKLEVSELLSSKIPLKLEGRVLCEIFINIFLFGGYRNASKRPTAG